MERMRLGITVLIAVLAASAVNAAEEIAYRVLSRDDFRATTPPLETRVHPAGLEAASCLRIVWPEGLRVEFEEVGIPGERKVMAVLTEVRFEAAFDRSCSWWNPTTTDPGYTRDHEQVHFAILEHAARELTREIAEAGRVVRARGASRESALEGIRKRLRIMAESAQHKADALQQDFDRETRRDRSPAVQRAWIDRYEHLLGEALVAPVIPIEGDAYDPTS